MLRGKFCNRWISTTSKEILRPVLNTRFEQPGMDVPLRNIPPLKPANQLQAPQTEETTFANGFRVVSQETYGQAATIGLFISAGSRYETEGNAGISHLLEHLCFRSTTNRTHAEIVKHVESIGGNLTSTNGREQLVLSIDVLRDYIEEGVALLSDAVLHPAIVEEEIEAVQTILKIDNENMQENPQTVVQERIHEAAYGRTSPLGRPLQAQPENISKLTPEVVREYVNDYFVAPRMILAGAGVEHDRLVAIAEKAFKHLPTESKHPLNTTLKPVQYTGGEVKVSNPNSELSYAALAFECGGWHDKDLVAVCVLQMLLGGGDSFSAGGPGKGMYSRLYTHVLNRYYWIESCQSFVSIHDHNGLLGISGSCYVSHTNNLIAILCNQMVAIAVVPVHETELSRAKNQLKSSVLMNLESRMILYEDIGRQLLTYNRRDSPDLICQRIDAITAADIQEIGRKIVSKVPSLVCYGDESKFPSFDQVQAAIQYGLKQ